MNKVFANNLQTGTPVHPGSVILDEIEARSVRQKDIAKLMGISGTMLSDLIHERRNVSADLALKLEKAFNISAMFWLSFQNKFDLDKARKKELAIH